MRTVFYYCQTSSNIAAPDRAIGTMWRVGAFRQWSVIGTVNVSLALRWSSALMTVQITLASNFLFSHFILQYHIVVLHVQVSRNTYIHLGGMSSFSS